LQAFFKSFHLAGLPKIDEGYFHFLRPLCHGWRTASSDKTGLNAHRVGKGKALSVLCAEHLHFRDGCRPAAIGRRGRNQADAAVCQSAVHIHQKELDLSSAR